MTETVLKKVAVPDGLSIITYGISHLPTTALPVIVWAPVPSIFIVPNPVFPSIVPGKSISPLQCIIPGPFSSVF